MFKSAAAQRAYIKVARKREAEKRKKDEETRKRYNEWAKANGARLLKEPNKD